MANDNPDKEFLRLCSQLAGDEMVSARKLWIQESTILRNALCEFNNSSFGKSMRLWWLGSPSFPPCVSSDLDDDSESQKKKDHDGLHDLLQKVDSVEKKNELLPDTSSPLPTQENQKKVETISKKISSSTSESKHARDISSDATGRVSERRKDDSHQDRFQPRVMKEESSSFETDRNQTQAAMLVTALEDAAQDIGTALFSIVCPELLTIHSQVQRWLLHHQSHDSEDTPATKIPKPVDEQALMKIYMAAIENVENVAPHVDRRVLLQSAGISVSSSSVERMNLLRPILLVRSLCILRFCVALNLLYQAAFSSESLDTL